MTGQVRDLYHRESFRFLRDFLAENELARRVD